MPDRAPLSEIALVRLGMAAYAPRTAILPPDLEQRATASAGTVQYCIYWAPGETVVAFAGSNAAEDWRRHYRLLRLPLPDNMQNRPGRVLSFHSAWMADATAALQQILPIIRPDYHAGRQLSLVGHSYGGPLAAFVGYYLRSRWPGVRLRGRTWGAPHPADRDLSRSFADLLPDWFAYENPGDIVTRVPFTGSRLGRRVRVPFCFPAHGLHHYAAAILTMAAAGVLPSQRQTTKNSAKYPPPYPDTFPASNITGSSPVTPTKENSRRL